MSVGDLYDVERTGEVAAAATRVRRRPPAAQARAKQPSAPPNTGQSGGVPITVLTSDAALADAIHDAAGSAHPVATATTLDEAIELAAHGRCAILITDQVASQPGLRRTTQRLREAEPALIVIAVGGAGDQQGLISLLSAGVVDRLMLKPVAPALAQTVLKSAAQQHRTLRGPGTAVALVDQHEPEVALVELQRHAANELTEVRLDRQPSPAEVVVPASLVTPLATGSRRFDIPRPPWTVVVAALLAVVGLMAWMVAQRKPAIDAQAVIASSLASGQQALREGHALEPRGRSAFDYYTTVLALDPANAAARQGIDRIADHFAAQAAVAVAHGQVAAALVAVESIRRVRPDHRQLAELQAQIDAAQEKYAAAVPKRVEPPPPQKPAPARPSTPTSTLERNGVEARARTMTKASEALQRDQLDLASALLSDARTLGVPDNELAAMNQALANAQQQRAKDDLLQRVLLRTAQNKLIDPIDDSAKFHLQQLVQLDPQFAGIPQAVAALGERLTLDAQLATVEKNFDLASRLLAQAHEIGFSGAPIEDAEAKLAAALKPVEPAPAVEPPPRVLRMVRPEYPQSALMSGAEGWVNVSLSVTPAGNVLDPRIVETSNGTMFDRAALAAVSKWKYEPFSAADPHATRPVTVRVEFKMKERR
jgi:TonB family protein